MIYNEQFVLIKLFHPLLMTLTFDVGAKSTLIHLIARILIACSTDRECSLKEIRWTTPNHSISDFRTGHKIFIQYKPCDGKFITLPLFLGGAFFGYNQLKAQSGRKSIWLERFYYIPACYRPDTVDCPCAEMMSLYFGWLF